jgi:hypothetical protein
MSNRSSRNPEVKAAVVAALLAGQSISQIAKQFKIPKGTVSNWKKRMAQGVQENGTQNGIGDLLVELVRENLKGLMAGAALLQDPVWMRKQGAAEVGTFLGITHDKTMRMLEAMDRSAEGEP